MNYYILILIAFAIFLAFLVAKLTNAYWHAFQVPEGYAGLLYHKGKFAELLSAGRHIRWGRHYTVDAQDLRKGSLAVAGQEVLTADNVSLKLSLIVAYQVADPIRAAHETQHWQGDLYNVAQLALRNVVSGVTVESLLNQRVQMGAQLVNHVQPQASNIGVTVSSVEVKDVIFPAELKRAFADVLKAKQEGQAALERARGESAALRNLATAAKLLEGNPSLLNLRLMQSLSAAQTAGSTLVLGMPGGFVPLQNGKASSAPEPPVQR